MNPSFASRPVAALGTLLLTAMSSLAMSADTVTVTQIVGLANEQDLIPGQVQFKRTGSSAPLTVRYRIDGDARSNLHGPHVSGAVSYQLNPIIWPYPYPNGTGYQSTSAIETAIPGGVVQGLFASTVRTGINMIEYCDVIGPGYGYRVPAVTINDGSGAGAVLKSVLVGGVVSKIAIEQAGTGYIVPTLTISGGGGTGASGRVAVRNGVVVGVTLTNGGTGYTSAPAVTLGGAPVTAAVVRATIANGQVDSLVLDSGGSGYTTPTITVSDTLLPVEFYSGGGTGARARATVDPLTGAILSVAMIDQGSGYTHAPTVVVPSASTTPAVLTANFSGAGQVTGVTVVSGGTGYAPGANRTTFTAYATFTGGGGSGAVARLTIVGGVVTGATIVSRGRDYTTIPTVTISASSTTAAVLTPTLLNGQINTLTVTSGGSGYVAGTGVSAVATVENGAIIAVDVISGGNGYGDASPFAAVVDPVSFAANFIPDVQVCGPDYQAPVNTQPSGAGLVGTITFQAGEESKVLNINPLRNGVGGGLYVLINIDLPSSPGAYIIGSQSSARISLQDADDRASIQVIRPVSYPTPPSLLSGLLPTVVEGRGEWLITMLGDYRRRRQEVELKQDLSVGPLATNGTDFWLVSSAETIDATADNLTYVVRVDKNTSAASPGSTVIGVASRSGGAFPPNPDYGQFNDGIILDGQVGDGEFQTINPGDVICFEAPNDPENGVYLVTAAESYRPGTLTDPMFNAHDGWRSATITITPPLRKISCSDAMTQGAAATRVRRLGRIIYGINSYQVTSARDQHFYSFAVQDNAPRGHKSIAMNMVQTNDFAIPSPAQGTVILADTSVTATINWGANAGKPNSNGHAEVVFNRTFPVDVKIPFFVKSSTTTATYFDGTNFATGDYSIPGISATTLIGEALMSAGKTTARIEVVPRMLVPPPVGESAETVEIVLADSLDYMIAPVGSSPNNPSAAIVISPPLYTNQGEQVFIAVNRTNDGQEGATPINGRFAVSLSTSTGAALLGTLTQNLTVSYQVAGSATAAQDYQALTGQVVIPAGSSTAAIEVLVIDDMAIEDTEDVAVQLLAGPGYQLSTAGNASLFILDDEPRLSISAKGNASESGTTGFFTVSTPLVTSRPILFTYAVSGTATPSTDYTALSGTGMIGAGQQSVTINVTAAFDGVVDPAETVTITINPDTANPATYALGTPSSDSIQIVDDMPLLIVSGTTNAIESGTAGAFIVTNTNVVNQAVSFTYTISGSAVAGVDYAALTGTATILANAATVTIPVVPIPDLVYDPNETVVISISNDSSVPPRYVVGAASSGTVIIIDDSIPSVSVTVAGNPVEGGAQGSFLFTASSAPATAITVAYAISGTATPGTDYSTLSGTVVIPAGGLSVSVPVSAVFDGITDPDETIIVSLQADSNMPPLYERGTSSSATMTIQNASSPTASTTPSASVPVNPAAYMSGSGGGGSGCGVGSGLGLVGMGAGLAMVAFLRRRRNQV